MKKKKDKKASKPNEKSGKKEQKKAEEKIQELEKMILTAQETILNAQQMIAQLKKENPGLAKMETSPASSSVPSLDSLQSQQSQAVAEDGQVVFGTFDGQVMIGTDKKQYPVPSNYASKSKLVEGDQMKLTITPDGKFVYKQVGPIDRKYLIGVVKKDPAGNFLISANGKDYRVLPAAATYFKIEPGDEVTIVVPRLKESVWAAIENVVTKAGNFTTHFSQSTSSVPFPDKSSMAFDQANQIIDEKQFSEEEEKEEDSSSAPSAIEKLKKEIELERKMATKGKDLEDEWLPDIEKLKKEASYPAKDWDEENFPDA